MLRQRLGQLARHGAVAARVVHGGLPQQHQQDPRHGQSAGGQHGAAPQGLRPHAQAPHHQCDPRHGEDHRQGKGAPRDDGLVARRLAGDVAGDLRRPVEVQRHPAQPGGRGRQRKTHDGKPIQRVDNATTQGRQRERAQYRARHRQQYIFGIGGFFQAEQHQGRANQQHQRQPDVRRVDPVAPAPRGQQGQRPGRPQIPGKIAQGTAHVMPGRQGEGRQVPRLPVADPILAAFAGRDPPGQNQHDGDQHRPRQPTFALP
ncbi:hypothetical protein D3C73_770800 [compost metagenome]